MSINKFIHCNSTVTHCNSIAQKSKSRNWCKQQDLPARDRQNSLYKPTSSDFPRNSTEGFIPFLDDDATF